MTRIVKPFEAEKPGHPSDMTIQSAVAQTKDGNSYSVTVTVKHPNQTDDQVRPTSGRTDSGHASTIERPSTRSVDTGVVAANQISSRESGKAEEAQTVDAKMEQETDAAGKWALRKMGLPTEGASAEDAWQSMDFVS